MCTCGLCDRMCVYVCVCTCVHVYCIYVCTCVYMSICVRVFTPGCACVYMCTCVSMYTCVCVYMCVCVFKKKPPPLFRTPGESGQNDEDDKAWRWAFPSSGMFTP